MIVADDEDDFGSGAPVVQPPANVIPFFRQKPDAATHDRWKAELEKAGGRYKFISPLGALSDMDRKRKMKAMPMPWPEFEDRCKLYPGEMMGVSGPTGGGKTSFAIQMARHVIGAGFPALWLPLELDPPQVNIRIVANESETQMYRIRDEWALESISQRLLQLNDRWRYVDFIHGGGWERQLEALRLAVQMAKRVYGVAPFWVIDYVGKLARGGTASETRGLLANAIEWLRQMTIDEECFGCILSQTSRGNNAVLSGKVDLESATDAIGVSAETGELEHAVAVNVGLNVFKLDDAPVLDSHVLITKARNTGREGRVGFEFHKAGGVWKQLASLPATPSEVTRELEKAKKDKNRSATPTAADVRADLNAQKSSEAARHREKIIIAVLARSGALGMETRTIAGTRGIGTHKLTQDGLDELERRGLVERIGDHWRLTRETT